MNLDDALNELNESYEHAPREAISFLLNSPKSDILTARITLALTEAYGEAFYNRYDANVMTPVWLSVVAENHLDMSFAKPVIKLLTIEGVEFDEFFCQMGMVLAYQLAQKYPQEFIPMVVKAIQRCIDRNTKSPYYMLFPVFRLVQGNDYKPELLSILHKEFPPFFVKYFSSLIPLGWEEVITFGEQIIARENEKTKKKYERSDLNELLYALEAMKGHRAYDYGVDLCTANYEERINYWENTAALFTDEEDEAEEEASKTPAKPAKVKVERNDPCPCGSGKKFKKCHEGAGIYD